MKKIIATIFLFALLMANAPAFTSTAQGICFLPEEMQETCVKVGEEYGICPELLMAVIERESAGDPDAKNGNCKGLMQISEKWHKDRMEKIGITDIYSIEGNIFLGADYLAELFEKYEDPGVALSVYHGESKGIENAKQGKFSSYVTGILERSAELERSNGK